MKSDQALHTVWCDISALRGLKSRTRPSVIGWQSHRVDSGPHALSLRSGFLRPRRLSRSLSTGSPLGFESSARGELERVKRDAGEGGGGRRGSSPPAPLPPRRYNSPQFFRARRFPKKWNGEPVGRLAITCYTEAAKFVRFCTESLPQLRACHQILLRRIPWAVTCAKMCVVLWNSRLWS